MNRQDRPELADRLLAIMRREARRPFPVWELCKRLWINWRTEQDRVPGEPRQIVTRVLGRLEREGIVERHPAGWAITFPVQEPVMWLMRANRLEFEFAASETPNRIVPGRAHVATFTDQGHFPLVVFRHGDPGNPQETAALLAEISRQFRLYPPNTNWINVRTRGPDALVWHRVTFQFDLPRFEGGRGYGFSTMMWNPMSRAKWETLHTTPAQLQEAMGLK